MVEATMARCVARGGGREPEDIDGYKGSFMELLIEDDDDRELEREKTEDANFVFFPTNRFLSVSSSSSTVQMLCFGAEEDYVNGGLLSIDQNCKTETRRKSMSVIGIGRGGGRCKTRGSALSTCGKRKRAKLEVSPVPRAVQMRREKLGSHVRALQQLVSPMGKSDMASVLEEAFGYIKFLHDQVQVLSSAYMEEETESAMEPDSGGGEGHLRKRGLCLVPVSSSVIMAGSNGADIWAPTISIKTSRNSSISPVGSKP